MMKTELFAHTFLYAAGVDIGAKRKSNQDEIICCPEYGFFAVSDGMGGLSGGAETSAMIAKALPVFIGEAYKELTKSPSPEFAAKLLNEKVRMISDDIYETLNHSNACATYGATLCGVWLTDSHAIFVNLGDSRGYWLGCHKRHLRLVTEDHNVAAILVANGELTSEEARNHHSSSVLTRFIGMESPVTPETFIQKLENGDMVLLCSDGLYGMLDDNRITSLMRSSENPEQVVKSLIDEANLAGGRDNISAVYISL